jgi:hypothetical protein
MRFHRFLKEHTNVKNTSTDAEGNKPEKVYKYDDITSSGMRYQPHPTSRCA